MPSDWEIVMACEDGSIGSGESGSTNEERALGESWVMRISMV